MGQAFDSKNQPALFDFNKIGHNMLDSQENVVPLQPKRKKYSLNAL